CLTKWSGSGMNFFRQVDLDWMGKAKFFIGLSLTLLLIGGISCVVKGGLRYGIDFKGGTLVYVRFAQAPPIDRIRQGLAAQGLGDSTIRSEEHTSELQSRGHLVCRLLL